METVTSERCNERYQRMVDEVLIGDLAPGKWDRLRGHLKGCEGCRNRYNRVVLAERMLHGGPAALDEPSPPELARVAMSVFPVAESRWSRMLQWAATPRHASGLVAAAAAVALIPILAGTMRHPIAVDKSNNGGPVELFQARGGLPALERQAGLRAFCLSRENVLALDAKAPELPMCDRSDQLKLTVTNPGAYKSVFLVGMDDDHAPKWYAPRPPEVASVPAPAGSVDAPVGGAVRLAVNHSAGRVRIFALFSDKPVQATEVESAIDELARRHVTATGAEALPLRRPDVLQRSLLVDIHP